MQHQGTQTIETERLILRKAVLKDAEAMYRNWASDPEVTKFLTWPSHTSVLVTEEILKMWIKNYEESNFYNWVIELKEIHEVIGGISVVDLYEKQAAGDIGYCIGRAFWGRGITAEALKAVIRFLFTEVGMNRVAACHDVNNPRSGRVMEKAGMKTEGILRARGFNNQGICDEVWHSILREEFTL